jgi:hypothetical protein
MSRDSTPDANDEDGHERHKGGLRQKPIRRMTSGPLLVEYRETAMCPQSKPVRGWSATLP